jgi:dTDP-4-dehydrorhamnose 3,5-epimerase-like enzyme
MTDIKPLSERIEIILRKRLEDSRGWFLKVITGKENGLPAFTGEIYTVYSVDGASRGGHYHIQATEWFTLLTGTASLQLKDIITNEVITLILSADNPQTIVVPPFVAHRFDSIDQQTFLLLAYTNLMYKPEDTISVIF